MKRNPLNALGLVLLGIVLIGVIALANRGLRGARADLTANKLFTLAPGTKNIVGNLREPVNLYFYYTAKPPNRFRRSRTTPCACMNSCRSWPRAATANCACRSIDPEPSSEEEDRASEAGLRSLPVGPGGEQLYFGLAGTNSTDGKAVIEFFDNSKEQFLEYDVAKLIQQLANPKKAVVGWLTGLPMAGSFDPQSGRPTEPWAVYEQAQQLFTVRPLDNKLTAIEPEVDVLVIVHPKNLPRRRC